MCIRCGHAIEDHSHGEWGHVGWCINQEGDKPCTCNMYVWKKEDLENEKK